MYLNPVTAEEAEKFLYGFDVGCLACGVGLNWHQIAECRGWNRGPTTTSLSEEMKMQGLSDTAIIDELISFRSEAARQRKDETA
jgi:hypothetical protein